MKTIAIKDWDGKSEAYLWVEIGSGEFLKVRSVNRDGLVFAGSVGTTWRCSADTQLYCFTSDDERREKLHDMRGWLAAKREDQRTREEANV